MSNRLLEICAYNVHTCMIADKLKAGRIELCSSPEVGGITPGFGTIEYVVQNSSVPVYVMIRPRGGNFVYDEHELEIMQRDIKICKILGAAGVVLGVLHSDNTVNVTATRNLVDYAHPMGVTFHKAFDETADASKALEDVISSGCERILTSGHSATAIAGSENIKNLVTQAAGRISIMAGGGVRSANVAQLLAIPGLNEVHSSALIAGSNNGIADDDEVATLLAAL